MKDLVDKSKIGLGNLIVEVLAKINQQSVSFFFIYNLPCEHTLHMTLLSHLLLTLPLTVSFDCTIIRDECARLEKEQKKGLGKLTI